MTNIKIIDDEASLEIACRELEQMQTIALDTEFMREKTFAPILCLIQVYSDHRDYCIDPLQINDLGAFGEVIAKPSVTSILHSCRQDFEAFDTRISQTIANLFDTQLAAAFCGYGDQVSYAALVEELTGVKLAKSHTRANWQTRPLSSSELEYAMDDVRYLEAIHDHLTLALEEAGRFDWFAEECARQLEPDFWRADPDQAWRRLKGGGNLPPLAHETARTLAVWREQQAALRNRPREWVLSTTSLLQISRACPANKTQLADIEGINSGVMRQSSAAILEICAQSPRDSHAKPLWVRQQLLDTDQKQRAKGIMNLLRKAAEELGISASLLANRNSVERFVRDNVEIELFRGWRRQVIGEQVLRDYS
ncbi:MAG: ribonuclease D [bacterium]